MHCNSENYTRISSYSDRWLRIRKYNRHTGEDVFMYFSLDEIVFIQKTVSSFLNKKEQTNNEN
ncbi:hypothetical protein RE474_13340 [Methanolobus sediminis]|uniref:Uncharacterized protein n=1 Tax=Methanolobus sediminis TaxID=3072978 RepID=A0AA51YIZ1_9EURY|nr:hypothetical protein [Methanolobus sediminis]WMW25046.1 hypothetical protein RE474_13340 [Methanolobus sediminis]